MKLCKYGQILPIICPITYILHISKVLLITVNFFYYTKHDYLHIEKNCSSMRTPYLYYVDAIRHLLISVYLSFLVSALNKTKLYKV